MSRYMRQVPSFCLYQNNPVPAGLFLQITAVFRCAIEMIDTPIKGLFCSGINQELFRCQSTLKCVIPKGLPCPTFDSFSPFENGAIRTSYFCVGHEQRNEFRKVTIIDSGLNFGDVVIQHFCLSCQIHFFGAAQTSISRTSYLRASTKL